MNVLKTTDKAKHYIVYVSKEQRGAYTFMAKNKKEAEMIALRNIYNGVELDHLNENDGGIIDIVELSQKEARNL